MRCLMIMISRMILVGKNLLNDKEPVIIELKDSIRGERLNFSHPTFKSYLSQLLYYMVITDVEKGILSISYNVRELNWIKRDGQGDHFIRPFDAKPVGIESWSIALPLNDIARELIRDQIIQRRERFVKALQNNAVETLPRLTGEAQIIKCKNCSYHKICFDQDMETLDAMTWGAYQYHKDPLGLVRLATYQIQEHTNACQSRNPPAGQLNVM